MPVELSIAQARAWRAEALGRARDFEEAPGWRTKVQEGPLSVEVLHPPGDHAVVRGEVLLAGPLASLAPAILLDRDASRAWDPTLSRWRVLARCPEEASELVQIDVLTGAHPLVRNRELVFFEATLGGTGVSTIARSQDLPQVPPLDGCRRAFLALAWRRLEPLDDTVLRYRAMWQTDMRGALPRGAVARGQVDAMARELRWFGEKWPAAPAG
ncbi:MAG: hypothetical protein H6742_08380 [Alphaproteobacteria bacterium]|nr:hypothetical protein [Alphaproteobacteria bacterium]